MGKTRRQVNVSATTNSSNSVSTAPLVRDNNVDLALYETGSNTFEYLTWVPAPLIVTGPPNRMTIQLNITSASFGTNSVTKLVFMENIGDPPQDDITITLGSPNEQTIYVAGKFQSSERHNGASDFQKDVRIEVREDGTTDVIGSMDVMVRVRKNANELSDNARNAFLAALAELNGVGTVGAGRGIYVTDFVDMHVGGSDPNLHRDAQFLPWHRLYILDLERQLQLVDPTVTLPYWNFDQSAPNVFHTDFFGRPSQIPVTTAIGGSANLLIFSSANPIANWRIRSVAGIQRDARFNAATQRANGSDGFALRSESATLSLGTVFEDFRRMEGTPHGAAHVSFNGPISSISTAPRDPIFFLLHSNVDRLWAKWQDNNKKFEVDTAASDIRESYPYINSSDSSDSYKLIDAQQWPWNGGNTDFIPPLGPPGSRANNFTQANLPSGFQFTGNSPTIKNSIDLYGYHDPENYIGFAYDDVPFDHPYAASV